MVLRVRKPGYTPYLGSLTLRVDREDTLRVRRLAQGRPEAYILAESGFGRDTFTDIELDSRMRWKSSMAGIASREALDRWVEAFEYHPTDLTKTIALRKGVTCNPRLLEGGLAGGIVIWLRRRR